MEGVLELRGSPHHRSEVEIVRVGVFVSEIKMGAFKYPLNQGRNPQYILTPEERV